MKKNKVVTTEDILLKLCQSVSGVLTSATSSQINYSAMVQKINKTSLKPDFGCFVLFDGGFTGLVVINFTAKAALEIYTNYMRNMGMPEEELAISHTSDEVGDVLGELMNQLVGDFTNKIRKELQTNITQNQPKMLSLNKQVILQVDTNLDRPQARRVTFSTANKINNYIDKEFKNIDRETFKKQLKEAMKNITADYEVGLKKGRKVSVNRGVGGEQARKMLGDSSK